MFFLFLDSLLHAKYEILRIEPEPFRRSRRNFFKVTQWWKLIQNNLPALLNMDALTSVIRLLLEVNLQHQLKLEEQKTFLKQFSNLQKEAKLTKESHIPQFIAKFWLFVRRLEDQLPKYLNPAPSMTNRPPKNDIYSSAPPQLCFIHEGPVDDEFEDVEDHKGGRGTMEVDDRPGAPHERGADHQDLGDGSFSSSASPPSVQKDTPPKPPLKQFENPRE